MPVTSVQALCVSLKSAGLRVENGGSHLRVLTADGAFVATVAHTPSDWRSLKNSRACIARRMHELATPAPRKAGR
jgi:hypothetical protein